MWAGDLDFIHLDDILYSVTYLEFQFFFMLNDILFSDNLKIIIFFGTSGSKIGCVDSFCWLSFVKIILSKKLDKLRGYGSPLQFSCLENTHRQRSLAGFSPWGSLSCPYNYEYNKNKNGIGFLSPIILYISYIYKVIKYIKLYKWYKVFRILKKMV